MTDWIEAPRTVQGRDPDGGEVDVIVGLTDTGIVVQVGDVAAELGLFAAIEFGLSLRNCIRLLDERS